MRSQAIQFLKNLNQDISMNNKSNDFQPYSHERYLGKLIYDHSSFILKTNNSIDNASSEQVNSTQYRIKNQSQKQVLLKTKKRRTKKQNLLLSLNNNIFKVEDSQNSVDKNQSLFQANSTKNQDLWHIKDYSQLQQNRSQPKLPQIRIHNEIKPQLPLIGAYQPNWNNIYPKSSGNVKFSKQKKPDIFIKKCFYEDKPFQEKIENKKKNKDKQFELMFQRIMTEIKKKSENNGQELINPDSHIFHNDVDHQKVLELNQRFKDKIEESKKAHQRLKELSKNFQK